MPVKVVHRLERVQRVEGASSEHGCCVVVHLDRVAAVAAASAMRDGNRLDDPAFDHG
jgi:hypothetical protein